MRRPKFDPILVEQRMVGAQLLPARADDPAGQLGDLEKQFTEKDPRKYALWRISMVRQFQPIVLAQFSDDDLLYLAGQTPDGYEGIETYGIVLDRNKVAQNAARASIELQVRAARGAWRRSLGLAIGGLFLGALLSSLPDIARSIF